MARKSLIFILLIAGISIIIYPFIAKYIAYKNQTIAISKYENNIDIMTNEEIANKIEKSNEYNINLYDNTNTTSNIDFLNTGDIIGTIIIPRINVNLPIYEGSTDKVLSKGVGHIKNTSLPCGGTSTHSVLVGHTGMTKTKIFDNLENVQIGDMFYIKYLDIILEYKVKEIKIILPEETEHLRIKENEDIVTLVTCTPRHINTHRLLVTGERVEYLDKIQITN